MRTPERGRARGVRRHFIERDLQAQPVQALHRAPHAPQPVLALRPQRLQQRTIRAFDAVREDVHRVPAVMRIDLKPGNAALAQVLGYGIGIHAVVVRDAEIL